MNCPRCQRLLYSRQHQHCGFCGQKLPAELLLSEAELAALKAEQLAIAERRARDREKEEEEKRRQTDGGTYFPPINMS